MNNTKQLSRGDMARPKFYLGRVCTRWHVYPTRQPLVAIAHDVNHGWWAYSKHGFWYKSPTAFNAEREVTEAEAVAHVVECVGCDPGHCNCNSL